MIRSGLRLPAPVRWQRYAGGHRVPRHRHGEPFATLVLAGRYREAGDSGRFNAGPGDVVLHDAFHAHSDFIGARGAVLLNLPLPETWTGPAAGRVADPDALARLAERDSASASDELLRTLAPKFQQALDWPDRLAADLIANPSLRIRDWACREGLHPAALGRGFRQRYGETAAAFRATARARQAVRRLGTNASLADVAAEVGFADQAHMSRAVLQLTGLTPSRLLARAVRNPG